MRVAPTGTACKRTAATAIGCRFTGTEVGACGSGAKQVPGAAFRGRWWRNTRQGKLLGMAHRCAVERTPTPLLFCAGTKRWNSFAVPREGGMTIPYLDGPWKGLLTSFLAASGARTSALPEKARTSTASAPAFGAKWQGLLEITTRFVLVVSRAPLRGLGTVLDDLAAMGFPGGMGVLSARHQRKPQWRDWIWNSKPPTHSPRDAAARWIDST